MSEKPQREDLRVQKTKKAIRKTFEEMLGEMDYEDITVKELTERAMINRKTFYLHYDSLDDLLKELQNDVVDQFIRQDVSFQNRSDIRRLIRFFFEYASSMPKLYERVLCSGSYTNISDSVYERIMSYRKEKNRGAFSSDEQVDNLVFAFFSANTAMLYRQWIADGKKLPLEDLINTATRLICNGLDSYVPEK